MTTEYIMHLILSGMVGLIVGVVIGQISYMIRHGKW